MSINLLQIIRPNDEAFCLTTNPTQNLDRLRYQLKFYNRVAMNSEGVIHFFEVITSQDQPQRR